MDHTTYELETGMTDTSQKLRRLREQSEQIDRRKSRKQRELMRALEAANLRAKIKQAGERPVA